MTREASAAACWDGSAMASQKGKLAIVTGASCGIGFETAKQLAANGAHVVLACRDGDCGRLAQDAIREALRDSNVSESGSVEVMQVDLSEPQSIRDFAQTFRDRYDHLDLLINNAGVAVPPQCHTASGVESHFAINYLGHFYLTSLQMDLLRCSRTQARIVNVTSGLHHIAAVDFQTMGRTPGGSMRDYAESKMANVLFTHELQRRLQAANVGNVMAVSAHPGVCHTEIWKKYFRTKLPRSKPLQSLAIGLTSLMPFNSQELGALPTLYAATEKSVRGGEIYGPDGWKTLVGFPARAVAHPASHSLESASKLWALSEDMLGTTFEV
ncbi:hypothetical protein BBJ28_00003127 [Nothophytophthora sp. Chile5]|nr:hypothetical protein BBJ28_00003127 [Nothophytophthora sp. Chile5]